MEEFMEENTMSPRERIDESVMRRMIDDRSNGCRGKCGRSCAQPRESAPGCASEATHTWGLTDHPLASVYAPLQSFRNLYDHETAFERGTIFAELDKPFVCGGMTEGGKCRGSC